MNVTTLWILTGAVFCLLELILPTAFVEATLGASAFVVALISLVVPHFGAQVVLWLFFSVVFTLSLRRLMPKERPSALEETQEARTLTEIPPGGPGRILYEGNSWQARCEDSALAIAPDQTVYIVRRKGNTLYVVPESLMRS
jgi:membrane protein implicated in regulation of membrane protease activity